MSDAREYWAFISYRHLDNQDPGREWATWMAREIETYEVPADLVGTKTPRGEVVPERLYPVFRDEDELSAGADLSSPIYQALRRSKSLVVICSPNAIGSRYVGNEISYFKSLDRPGGVLAMMIEGEPHTGDHEAALNTANEALGHHRQLADGDPGNLQMRRNLLLTLPPADPERHRHQSLGTPGS